MSCYHPMKAFDTGYLTDNGKPAYIIKPYHTKFIHKPQTREDALEKRQDERHTYYDIKIYDFVEICCQKCVGCRLEYSRQWAMRCMLEQKDHENNQFITLTYDPEHLPTKQMVDTETGEVFEEETLVPDHVSEFMKKLRRYYEYHYGYGADKIKFYACGEYGDKKGRPHYHLIIYDLPIFDKRFSHRNKKGTPVYTSDTITKIWGKGRTAVDDVTYESCAYVARYIMKKIKGKEAVEELEASGKVNCFTRMSRKPGIGRNYYDENADKIYECDEIWLKNKYGPLKLKPPKYYDKLFDIDNPEKMEEIKDKRRKIAEMSEETRLKTTGEDKLKYLERMEQIKFDKMNKYKRELD